MLDELNKSIEDYHKVWAKFVAERRNKKFFEGLKQHAVGWKTEDLKDFDQRFKELREQSDQIHLGWVDERWLATFHLKTEKLTGGIQVIKLMQRRPGSKDAVGLDHIDFFVPVAEEDELKKDPKIKWTNESNDYCNWISIWFDNGKREAKLRNYTVLDVCVAEMQVASQKVVVG